MADKNAIAARLVGKPIRDAKDLAFAANLKIKVISSESELPANTQFIADRIHLIVVNGIVIKAVVG